MWRRSPLMLAWRGAKVFLLMNSKKNEARKKKFIKASVTVDYKQSIESELLIDLAATRGAQKEADDAAAEAWRLERSRRQRALDEITCKVPDCKVYEHSSKDRVRNPFTWCDYCFSIGI